MSTTGMSEKIYLAAKRFISSKRFFYAVIALVIFQGAWFAFTYEPGLFDEKYHFDFINMYTERLNPFISSQAERWDVLGDTTRNTNYLFYYLVSFPLRAIKILSDSYFVQVVTLRVAFLGIFILGLFAYRKLLLRLTKSLAVSHLALLVLVLLPVVATLPAIISYDIIIFALFPWVMLLVIDQVSARTLDVKRLILLLCLSLFASLMKFSFLPILVAVLLFVVIDLWRKYGKRMLYQMQQAFKKITSWQKAVLIVPLVLLSVLIIERPVMNFIRYQRVTPSCTETLSEERCLKNYTSARSINFKGAKSMAFTPMDPVQFFLEYWMYGMLRTGLRIFPDASIPPLLRLSFYGAALTGIGLILLYLRDLWKNRELRTVMLVSLTYILALIAENYAAYIRLGQPVAISARYLLPILPIIIALALLGLKKGVYSAYPRAVSVLGALWLIVLITQGGSITTHLLTVRSYYWSEDTAISHLNDSISRGMKKIVLESVRIPR